MKVKIIDYDNKYERKLKSLYMTNITRTAVPDGLRYQNQLYQKYGSFFMRSCYFVFGVVVCLLLNLIFSFQVSFILSTLFIFIFIERGYITVLVKLLIYYYCYKVFTNDFKDINKYYGKNNNKLWLAIDEDTDDVLGVAAFDEDTSLLDDLNLWDVITSSVKNKKKEDIKTCEIKRMSVSPKTQGLGIGKKLTETFNEYAQKKGFDIAYLTTYEYNQAAIKLYASRGFYHTLNFPFDKAHSILNLQVAFMVNAYNK